MFLSDHTCNAAGRRLMAAVNPPIGSEIDPDPDSGVEPEHEEAGATKRPFNPEKIKIRTVNVVVDQNRFTN